MDMLASSRTCAGISLAGDDTSVGSALALVMDALAHGVLIASAQRRLLHANHSARCELACRRVLEIRHGVLHACAPCDGKSLEEAWARLGEGKRSLVEMTGADGIVVSLAVLPLKPQEPGGLPGAALLFGRAAVCGALMLRSFARTYALTATEEHVLGILCDGFTAPQIATQMQVAVSTIRSHVRSLCSKTHSSGVRQLVNRVALLPPIAPPFRALAMH